MKLFVSICLAILSIIHSNAQNTVSLEEQIDQIVSSAIKDRVFPGCVVYSARKGKPFFFKAYGYHTYDSAVSVQKNTIYDLASVTKVTASTLALMKLWEEGRFSVRENLGAYIEGFNPYISQLKIDELMTHQSGMPPGVRFTEKIKAGDSYQPKTISKNKTNEYDYRIGPNMYAYGDLWPILKGYVNEAPLSKEKKFKYSGLFFYMVPEIMKNLTDLTLDQYVTDEFYRPIGAKSLVFNPLNTYSKELIAPTEIDNEFRKELVHGTVHDEGAALMRGVCGNAGLFGNAEDLAKVWNMLLNDGVYDSVRYLNPETIHFFTGLHFPENDNHRGLGFDKPFFEFDPDKSNYAESASPRSYGHTGFTGTIVWADPDEDLLFIFLSNRVYPSRTPNLLKDLRIRPIIHQLIYDHLKSSSVE